MSEAATAPEHTAMGRLLDVIERAGNKVPHPVLMFLYLMIGVIVLSAILAFAGVSVTDEIAVPDTVEVIPDYYEDSTQPILEPGRASTTRAAGTSRRSRSRSTASCRPKASASSSRPSCRTSRASGSSRSRSSP